MSFRLGGKTHNTGNTLGRTELEKLLSTGYTPSSIIQKAREQGLSISDSAKTFSKNWNAPSFTPTSSTGGSVSTQNTQTPFSNTATSAPTGVSRDEGDYLFQSGLINLQGDIQKELEALRGATGIKVAEIGTGAQVRSSELDKEARSYIADIQRLSASEVETLRGQNDLNLQNVVNAGLKDVESIRERTALGVAQMTGEYGVKQEAERQRGQKDIANIGSASSLRNALVGAFSF